MQQSTLNQVKDRLQVIVLDNPLIRTFEWEQLSETNTESDFPLAHVFVGEGVNQIGSVLNLPINIMLMDLVQKDSSNKFEVSSDMLQAGKNILAALRMENDYFVLDKDTISMSDFYTEKFDTEACGWILTFTLKVANPYDSCGLPYTPVGVASIPVTNSDGSFTAVATPPEYVIPDTTYNFYVGSNPVVTTTVPTLKDTTFNIVWQ